MFFILEPATKVLVRALSHTPKQKSVLFGRPFVLMAGVTGLEPATFCVTGRRSNQLIYHTVHLVGEAWALSLLRCKVTTVLVTVQIFWQKNFNKM